MFDSIALVMSEADRKIGHIDEAYLSAEDLAGAVFETLAYRGLISQQSEYGRLSQRTKPFYVNARESLFTQAPDMVMPTYLEVQRGSTPIDQWTWIPIVTSSLLEQTRAEGRRRCCFEKEPNGFVLRLSYDPTGLLHRVRYFSDPVVPGSIDDPLPLAPRFATMIVYDTIFLVIPTIFARSAQLEADGGTPLTTAQMGALNILHAQAAGEREKWEKLHNVENRADRNATGRNRSPILSGGGMWPRRTY